MSAGWAGRRRAGGRLKGAFSARCRRAEGYDARRGGGAAAAAAGPRRLAAAALEVPEFQRRKNGKRAKPKCPRGARPGWGRPALPHPRLAAPPVPSPLPRSQPGTSGRCQGLWHLRERWARGAALSTRAPARDGDACTPWLNWR